MIGILNEACIQLRPQLGPDWRGSRTEQDVVMLFISYHIIRYISDLDSKLHGRTIGDWLKASKDVVCVLLFVGQLKSRTCSLYIQTYKAMQL
jgi:hypothetical protein